MPPLLFSLIRFEAVPDAGGPIGGGEPDPGVAPDVFADPDTAAAAAAAAAGEQPVVPEVDPGPQWTPEREQQFEQMGQFVGQMQEAFAQAEREEQEAQQRAMYEQAGQLPEFDPLDPQNVTQHVAAGLMPYFQAMHQQNQQLMEQLQAIQPFALSAAEQRGEEISDEVFDRLEAPQDQGGMGLGNFDRELALTYAALAQDQGYQGDQALMQGALQAKRIADRIRSEGSQEVLDHQERVRGLRGEAPAATGAAVPGEEEVQGRQPRSIYRDTARRSLSRLRAVPPQ